MPRFDQRGQRFAALAAAVGLLAGSCLGLAMVAPANAQSPAAAMSAAQSANPSAGLQRLVDELSTQFWFSYRANVPEFQLRHEQLRQAITAWNASSQNADDHQLMARWLRDAVRRSMPGSHEPLPPLPKFDRPAAPSAETSSTSAPSPPVSVTSEKPAVPDVPAESDASRAEDEPVETHLEEDQDFWFSEPDVATPVDNATGNPFVDDPMAE